jgi:hypothetical protein
VAHSRRGSDLSRVVRKLFWRTTLDLSSSTANPVPFWYTVSARRACWIADSFSIQCRPLFSRCLCRVVGRAILGNKKLRRAEAPMGWVRVLAYFTGTVGQEL